MSELAVRFTGTLGEALRRHQQAIAAVQWAVVAVYLVLVTVPAFLPLPDREARLLDNLTLFAQFAFWGLWWPFVLLATMGLGRVWCGLLCPEGTLTEAASRHGLGRPVPRWLKWGGWPVVAFVLTTVYGQLVSVYEYPKAALLVLGGSTVAAVAVGWVYGRDKRVWCRHLCPVSGVFALLSRLSAFHFKVDRENWRATPRPAQPVNCAPLLDLRRMQGASQCHMCGRCSGHRESIRLAPRLPGSEVVAPGDRSLAWDARLLVFGLIGAAAGAFQWSASPWFVHAKLAVATWLVERDNFLLLQDNAPWWLLTHYPEANDVFTWLDGLAIVAYIGVAALLLGLWASAWLALAARLAGRKDATARHRLALGLTPIGGFGAFLGLSALTATLLSAEGIALPWLPGLRAALLTVAVGWSMGLGYRLLPVKGRLLSFPTYGTAVLGLVSPWAWLFFVW
jgi:polyferredoxin